MHTLYKYRKYKRIYILVQPAPCRIPFRIMHFVPIKLFFLNGQLITEDLQGSQRIPMLKKIIKLSKTPTRERILS